MKQLPTLLKVGLITAVTMLAAGLLMACGVAPPPPTPDPPPRPTDVQVAVVPPPTPTTPVTPTPLPATIAPDDGCVECHTNEKKLQALAEEEEEVEELSEGEG